MRRLRRLASEGQIFPFPLFQSHQAPLSGMEETLRPFGLGRRDGRVLRIAAKGGQV